MIGVGTAGGNLLAHLAPRDLPNVTFAHAVTKITEPAGFTGQKILLGRKVARGIGAGGDPEMGRAAALENLEEIKKHCAGCDVIFLLAGLGGGTGTGAAPIVAQAAKEAGALVFLSSTLGS